MNEKKLREAIKDLSGLADALERDGYTKASEHNRIAVRCMEKQLLVECCKYCGQKQAIKTINKR